MGTSSARKAPVGKFWRTAKAFASRYASGKEAAPPEVREVVARYLMALHTPGLEAGLPDIVRTAASLGIFYQHWQQHGFRAALENLGVHPATPLIREALMPLLLDRLAGPGARLDEAAARAALADHLTPVLSGGASSDQSEPFPGIDGPGAMAGVKDFLGLALVKKLQSDLGETLEFHAPNVDRGYDLQGELRTTVLASVQSVVLPEIAGHSCTGSQAEALLDQIITHLGGRHEL